MMFYPGEQQGPAREPNGLIHGIHRVAICVDDLGPMRKAFEEKLGCEFFDPGVYEPLGVHSITDVDRGLVLTQATRPDSPIAETFRRGGQRCFMICFRVRDLEEAKVFCKEHGVDITNEIHLTSEQSERYEEAGELVLDPECFPQWGGNFMMFYGKE